MWKIASDFIHIRAYVSNRGRLTALSYITFSNTFQVSKSVTSIERNNRDWENPIIDVAE